MLLLLIELPPPDGVAPVTSDWQLRGHVATKVFRGLSDVSFTVLKFVVLFVAGKTLQIYSIRRIIFLHFAIVVCTIAPVIALK